MQEMGKCALCKRDGAQWVLKKMGKGKPEKFLVHYPCGRSIIKGAPLGEKQFLKLMPNQEVIRKSQVEKFWRQRIAPDDNREDVKPPPKK